MKRTFVDSGVLIACARGDEGVAQQAFMLLDDPDREFVSSLFVKLETYPKATYNRRRDELAIYQAFFDMRVTQMAEVTNDLISAAFDEACRFGIGAVDALHVAAAVACGAEELITIENETKPLYRTRSIRVISLRAVPNSQHS